MTSDFILAFPDFFAEKLAVVDLSRDRIYLEEFVNAIPPNMWNSENFAQNWLELGFPLLGGHPEDWRADPDKLLLVAKHCAKYEWKRETFQSRASEELRGNANFMGQVMRFDPCLFECATKTLRDGNYELAIWALGDVRFMSNCVGGLRAEQRPGTFFLGPPVILTGEKFTEFLGRAEKELALHDAFVNPFLCAVQHDESTVNLGKLNQSLLLKAIGDFLGIPRGNNLCNVRKALLGCQRFVESGNE